MPPDPIRMLVVKAGREWAGLMHLNPGDVIAGRWYDPHRALHVVEIATPGVPASPEVKAAGWSCEDRGCRYVRPNGVPSASCVECGGSHA